MDAKLPTHEELVELTRRQARQIDELRAEVERLKAELEQSRRAGKRQAAPFSQGLPKADPKRPGRKAGHPPSHRPAPPPEQVDRTIEVPLPSNCPECHAPLGEAPVTIHDQYHSVCKFLEMGGGPSVEISGTTQLLSTEDRHDPAGFPAHGILHDRRRIERPDPLRPAPSPRPATDHAGR